MVRNYVRVTSYMTVNPDHVEVSRVEGPDRGLPRESWVLVLEMVSGASHRIPAADLYSAQTIAAFVGGAG